MSVKLQDLLSRPRVQSAKCGLAVRLYRFALRLEPAIGLAVTETITTQVRLELLAHQRNVSAIASRN